MSLQSLEDHALDLFRGHAEEALGRRAHGDVVARDLHVRDGLDRDRHALLGVGALDLQRDRDDVQGEIRHLLEHRDPQRRAAPDDAETDLRAIALVVDDGVLAAVDDRDHRGRNLDVVAGEEGHRHHEAHEPEDDRENDRRRGKSFQHVHPPWGRAFGPVASTRTESPESAVIRTPVPAAIPCPAAPRAMCVRPLSAHGQRDLPHPALRDPDRHLGRLPHEARHPDLARGLLGVEQPRELIDDRGHHDPGRDADPGRGRMGHPEIARHDAAHAERRQEGADDPRAEDAGPVAMLHPGVAAHLDVDVMVGMKQVAEEKHRQEKQKPEGPDGRIEEHRVTLSPVSGGLVKSFRGSTVKLYPAPGLVNARCRSPESGTPVARFRRRQANKERPARLHRAPRRRESHGEAKSRAT